MGTAVKVIQYLFLDMSDRHSGSFIRLLFDFDRKIPCVKVDQGPSDIVTF